MKWRVLICRSNPIAPDPRVEKEALTLSEAGYSVTLLGWDRTAKLPAYDSVVGLPCHRLPIKAEYARGIHNLPDLLRWQMGLLKWLIRQHKEYDIIHACDFDTVLPALLCKAMYGKKVVYDIFDFYADHLRSTPAYIKKTIQAADLYAINRVDALILADESRKEQIGGVLPANNTVIYNSPPDRTNFDATRPTSTGLNLVYVGLLQVERGLLQLMDVLAHHPDWSLDLAGFGGDQETILSKATTMPNVNWHGRISYDLAIQLSQAADVLFATYDPAIPNHRYASPNKVFEAMMLGKPIIVAQNTNMDRMITASNCGLVVTYGDVPSLEAALNQLASDNNLRLQMGHNARKAYETTYDWEIMQNRLLNLYEALFETSPKINGTNLEQ